MSDTENPQLSVVDFDPFAGPQLVLTAPTTESQREIWAATRMGADASCAFNESNTLQLLGPLDVPALRTAFADVVHRHEALRSTFAPDGTTVMVAESIDVGVPLLDYSALDLGERTARIEALLAGEVEQPFDLEQGPLIRANLVRVTSEEHLFIFTAHHLVCDGWSTGVVIRDLGALYSSRRLGSEIALGEPFAFSAYAHERQKAELSTEHAEAEEWWLHQFAGPVPSLDLPFDATRPALKTYGSARADSTLSPELTTQLKRLAVRYGSSFFTVLLAGFSTLLHRLSGADDVIVGIPSAGQASSGHPQLVGHCVNTLPIRCRVDPADTFAELVGRVRRATLDATEQSDYTFGRLVRKLAIPRDPSRLPLVSVLFNLDQEIRGGDLRFEGLQASFASNPRHFENFDLFVNAVEIDGAVRLECQYNTDLLQAATAQRWLDVFEMLLRSAVAAPEDRLERLRILPDADRQALATWNNTTTEFPRTLQVHDLVYQQVLRTPDTVAVVSGDYQVTYKELDRRSNRLARRLRMLGVDRNVRVGLSVERSVEMLVALLAVSKAGGAYVPLDPAYPRDRLAFMVRDSSMRVIVTQASVREQLPDSDAHVLSIDQDSAAIAAESDAPLEALAGATPEDVAYVIYTSGSTGIPKGVLVPHRAVVNLLSCTPATPGMCATDVVVAITTLSFDIAVFDLWLPLTLGARIVIAPRDAGGDGPLLLDLLHRVQATVLQATPATWRLLIEAGWEGGEGLKAISTGEALPLSLAQELSPRAGELWNMYGPTETTVWSSHHRLPKSVDSVPIGRPMANTQLHVLDSQLQQSPIGVPGELFIGGAGVTLGYLDRPALTAERFIADPFSSVPAAMLYRTGDLVRWRVNGTLEYLGRNDYQVKVRGFRIELGEIEALLMRHPAVAESVVMAREDRIGDVRLVAYFVARAGANCSEDELRGTLQGLLPDYMVPQHLVQLDALPLTPNGKVNRAALPAPEASAVSELEYVAPRNEDEQLLASLWQEILGIGRIGIHDDFFKLGGHSLLAAQVVSRLSRDRGIALAMRSLFEAPTIARLAPLLSNTRKAVRIPRRAAHQPARASIMQRRSTLLEQIGSGRRTFNLPAAWRLTGDLDAPALKRAINTFVEHQESTRTTLRWYGEQVVQTIAPDLEIDVTCVDLRSVPAEQREAALRQQMLTASDVPFDLEIGPLFRAQLFRLADDEHVLFLLVHHAIWDGWSFDIFVREIDRLYRAHQLGETVRSAEVAIRYTDFAEWHNTWLDSSEVADQEAYWHKQLSGDVPTLELPTDHPRPKLTGDAGATEWVEISRAEADALTALGRREGVTLFVLLLAAFQTMLHRYSGQNDFLVATPVRGRSQPELEEIVGWFVNTVVLRADFAGDPAFAEVLQRTRMTVLDAFSHQDVPFEHLLMSRNPAYRAFFSFQDARNRPVTLGNLALRQVHVLPEAAANDVSLWIMENDAGLVGGLNYSTELFDRSTMQQFVASFRTLLRSIVTDPRRPISSLSLVSESAPLPAAVDSQQSVARNLVHSAFESHADRVPSAVAVVAGEATLTYAQLDRQANALALRLRTCGVRAGARVALCTSGLQRIVGLLAIAKAGGAVVLMDPSDPEAWLARVSKDAQPLVALVHPGLETALQTSGAITLLTLDQTTDAAARLDSSASPDDVALVAYTVGTDGAPLAVQLTHAAVSHVLTAVASRVGLGETDRFVAVGAPGSGRAFLETYLPFIVGAAFVIADGESTTDGQALGEVLVRSRATVLHASPSTWRHLIDAAWRGPDSFVALLSGEPVPGDLSLELVSRVGRAFSMYGQAETGFWCAVASLEALPERSRTISTIGTPVPGVHWSVVDSRLQLVPPGIVGELLVEGATLAREHAGHFFRTGDLVRVRGDGSMEYRGRADDRMIIQGRRVEPIAIEQALQLHPAVLEAAAAMREEAGQRRLVAWVVPKPGNDYTDSDLRRAMRRVLPDAMVPRRYIELDVVPRLSDGRVNRAGLPALRDTASVAAMIAPRTDAERLLGDLWLEALSLEEVGVHDNFFDLGGHSLLCIQVIARIENVSGQRLSPRLLLLNTLEQVAAQLDLSPRQVATALAPH